MQDPPAYNAKQPCQQDVVTWMHAEIERYKAELQAGYKMTFVFHISGESKVVRFEHYEKK